MAHASGQPGTLNELRNLSEVELQQQITQRRAELAVLRAKAHQGALEQPHRIRQLRRDIARLLTIANGRSASS